MSRAAEPTAEAVEASLHRNTASGARERGEDYRRKGRVQDAARRGDEVTARVRGSHGDRYHVRLLLDPGGVARARCDCPYDEGWCKHVVATARAWLRGACREAPTLDDLLADRSAEELAGLVRHLVGTDSRRLESVEAWLRDPVPVEAPAGPLPPRDEAAPVDPQRSLASLEEALAYWGAEEDGSWGSDEDGEDDEDDEAAVEDRDGWDLRFVTDVLSRGVEDAGRLVEDGRAADALGLLDAVTDAYVWGWYDLRHEDPRLEAVVLDLARVWRDALEALPDVTWTRERVESLEGLHLDLSEVGGETFLAPYVEAGRRVHPE